MPTQNVLQITQPLEPILWTNLIADVGERCPLLTDKPTATNDTETNAAPMIDVA